VADAERDSEKSCTIPAYRCGPEALYWAGVARYKATGDAASLKTPRARSPSDTRKALATKASVWR